MIASLKERIAARGYVLNGYCQMPGAFSAEAYARQGWDSVTLDLEHGMIGEDMAILMLQALTAIDVVPLCRVGWLDPAIIMKVLDAGALGVTCPMVSTAEDAALLVHYCMYPPKGERSFGPLRPNLIYGRDYVGSANDIINVFPMIETAEAVENIEKIAAVPGIGGLYIGSADLARSMGRPVGRAALDPAVARAVDRVLQVGLKAGMVVGMMARDGRHARELIGQGFRFVGIATDFTAMTQQAKAWVDAVRAAD